MARPRLSSRKGNELLGVLLGTGALLLTSSLLTFDPRDPSVLHRTAEPEATRNLIGPFGAEVAAVSFGLLGLTALAIPLLLGFVAWRRLRPRPAPQVFGRGVGAGITLVVLPPLAQLLVRGVSWRGEELAAGGVLGRLAADSLEARLHLLGSLLVLGGLLTVGLALLVQSTLGDLLVEWGSRLGRLCRGLRMSFERRRERREKERARRRVVAKHLERASRAVAVQSGARGDLQSSDALAEVELRHVAPPVRVLEKKGPGGFALRRVARGSEGGATAAAPQRAATPPAAGKRRAIRPQSSLPFEDQPLKSDLPPLNLLNLEDEASSVHEDDLVQLGEVICKRCREFGVEGTIEGISPGPVITVFELQPAPGVKVSQIVNLQDDLALALKAEAIRVDRLAGRSTLGIEVPNPRRSLIRLGSLLAEEAFRRSPSPLTMAIGKTLQGQPYYVDLTSMPHLLVAGATGAGKSVGLQSMITSILYKATREQVQFIFIDPKRIELGAYDSIPHLKTEVVVEPKKAANALRWAVAEMERRYRLLAELHVRSIDFYNRAIADPEVQRRLALREEEQGEGELSCEDLSPLPYYVVVIDELADLMMVSSSEVESSIARLAQMARAVGIHLIVATQRPSVDVLTGTIKANFPCRISYATATRHDSRTILDQIGAEKLLGMGDMLFMPPGSARTVRLHGGYVSEQETAALVRWLKKRGQPDLDPAVLRDAKEQRPGGEAGDSDDELFDDAARLVVGEGQASASFLQRRMRVGFSRAARLIDMMELEGILGPAQGSRPREILVKPDYFEEVDRARQEG